MRVSKLFGKTSKTDGLDYKIKSHKLLVQAGFIRESTAGRYYMLPLGMRVHNKITEVIRRQMDKIGAQELVTPTLHPLELWKETNRTSTTGFELMTVKDRREADFALGGTAEEMIVDLVRHFNISYKDLPFNIYQFSLKFRDELRSRGGLLRVREFVMKDAYSFSTEAQFEPIYKEMSETYTTIFNELGVKTDIVAADNGYIGGEYCHEFIVESEEGESRYFIDENGGYAAHEDIAVGQIDEKNTSDELLGLESVDAVRGTTMEDGQKLHNLPMWQQLKDVLFFDEPTKRYILAVIRGDFDVNETKLTHAANAWGLRPATEEEVRDDLGSEPGFISPVGFPRTGIKSGFEVIIVADKSLRTVRNLYGGANTLNKDSLNINIDRDFKPGIEADILLVKPGMPSPAGGILAEKRGIEVGNIFQLGYHYSNLMSGAEYTDDTGKRQKYYMGCYGIGIGRTMAAIVEICSDEKGIIWPEQIAPYAVYLVSVGEDEAVKSAANKLYEDLEAAGVEVLYDDRDARPGEKFADADLLGIPHRLVISPKTLEQDSVEIKQRSASDVEMTLLTDVVNRYTSK